MSGEEVLKNELVEMLKGGFAPNVILLREFDFDKAGVVLPGLPYSTWGLLEHMRQRQHIFLQFMRQPQINADVWPNAYWPEQIQPNRQQWEEAINIFERDLEEIIEIVKNVGAELFAEQQKNGKSLYWAALANLHHNGYHIGQIKAIGRQLGVW